MLKVMLAVHQTLLRRALRCLLESSGAFQVVGETDDGAEALPVAAATQPTVLVMEVELPSQNGIEATRAIRGHLPAVRVLLLAAAATRQRLIGALRAGASGYLLEAASETEFFEALNEVAAGRRYLSADLSAMAVDCLLEPVEQSEQSTVLGRLTQRERAILRFLGQNGSDTAVAGALNISQHTVRTHRRNIMEKLDLHNRVDLVKFAIRSGLATLD